MQPNDSKFNYDFNINGNDFSMGLYELHATDWPDVLTPVLLIKEGSNWAIVKQYDTLWADLQEDLGEEYLAQSIVDTFNKALEKYKVGGEMTFNQKLIAIFQLRLALVGEVLVLK